jgi:hypothetical protein
MNSKVITYILSSVIILAFLQAQPLDKKVIPDESFTSITSRVIVGEGARIIVDAKASARIWYDDILLSKGSKLQYEVEEQKVVDQEDTESEVEMAEVTALPTELMISRPYPNPFNPTVRISYGLPVDADVRILIHDLGGRKIAEFSDLGRSAGWHEFNWNAMDQNGQLVGSGIYLLTIHASDMIKKQKITYIK